jgi:hypothetical protein
MTTPTVPKKTSSSTEKRARLRTKGGQFRARRKTEHTSQSSGTSQNTTSKTIRSAGESEQLIILVAALGFGLVGLAVHILWIVSIVLMALLVGLIGADARRQRGHGLVAEVVAEARGVADDIGAPALAAHDEPVQDASPEETSGGS